MDPARRLAAALRRALGREGLEPPDLALLRLGSRDDQDVDEVHDPDDLGPLHEALTGAGERVRRGAWYTPADVAEHLVARTLDGLAPTPAHPVVDPACGGGVFLLAAARHLRARGTDVGVVVASLWGADVDPLAVAVTEAALWWWSAREGSPTLPTVVVGDALDEGVVPTARAVVGNPPFRGQLRGEAVADGVERERRRERFGDLVGAYTDPAWLFLVAAVEATVPGGRVVLVQPQSLLGARDAARVRAAVDAGAEIEDCWIGGSEVFAAAVDVCAPILRIGTPAAAGASSWTGWLADALGVPDISLGGRGRLGDAADVRAGFRDEFYGLVDHVTEGGPGCRVVTAGDIDPWVLRSDRRARLGGRSFDDPHVRPAALSGRAATWVEAQRRPKVLVATQTKVIEALADPGGELVGSVPVLVVEPHDPARVHHVAACLSAPAVSAWLLRASAGTALSRDACRPTSALVQQIPLPVDGEAWDEAVEHLARLHERPTDEDVEAFADAAARMYALEPTQAAEVAAWWRARLPRRTPARSA